MNEIICKLPTVIGIPVGVVGGMALGAGVPCAGKMLQATINCDNKVRSKSAIILCMFLMTIRSLTVFPQDSGEATSF